MTAAEPPSTMTSSAISISVILTDGPGWTPGYTVATLLSPVDGLNEDPWKVDHPAPLYF